MNTLHEDGSGQVDVGIVIVNWNTRDLLRDCLTSVAASLPVAGGGVSARVVVVDNASDDGSAEMVRAEFPDVLLIANTANNGYPSANNQGFRALGFGQGCGDDAPRYALALNPDTVLPPTALGAMVAYMDADPRIRRCRAKARAAQRRSRPGVPAQLPDAADQLLPDGRPVQAVPAQPRALAAIT